MSLIEHLMGPHEWGYRDPVEGGFIPDGAPFDAADRIEKALFCLELAGNYASPHLKEQAVKDATAFLTGSET